MFISVQLETETYGHPVWIAATLDVACASAMTTVKTVHVILRPKKTTNGDINADLETKKLKSKRRNSLSSLSSVGKELVRKFSFRKDGLLRRSFSKSDVSLRADKKMPVPTVNGNGETAASLVVELQKKDTGLFSFLYFWRLY